MEYFVKNIRRIAGKAAVVLLGLLLSVTVCPAQTPQAYQAPPVTISREKVRIDGKMYYSHVVLEKQTLYSISKAYNVSIEELYSANPSLEIEGLKKNSIIFIPIKDASAQTDPVVIPVSQAEPAADSSAAPAPVTAAAQVVRGEREMAESEVVHTVKWYESIEDVAGKYDVTVESIMKANGMTDRKVSTRQQLIIPQKKESAASEEAVPDSLGFVQRNVNMLMMLPLKLAQKPEGETNYMDFYCGALTAARDAGLSGMNLNIQVIDISDGLPELDYSNVDVIIGPVNPSNIVKVLDIVPSDVMVVSPMNPKVQPLVAGHPNLIHAPTPAETQLRNLISWIKEDTRFGDDVIVFHENMSIDNASATEDADVICPLMDESNITFRTFSYNILEGRDIADSLNASMSYLCDTRIIIASESEAFVGDVVRNLAVMAHKGHKPILYSQSKIKSFETIDAESLHNINLHICQSYQIDYEEANVQSFLLKYRALYNTEPGPFAFQGYDLTAYFTSMIARYGAAWTSHLSDGPVSGLQSDFKFEKTENGGWTNTATQRLVYSQGYKISKTGMPCSQE